MRVKSEDRRLHMLRDLSQRYALRCPAACGGPVAEGQAEAARVVREHLAVCPNPGRAYSGESGTVFHPLVYADRIR